MLPDWIDPEVWTGFEEMRVKIKKPMTDRARELVVIELGKLKASGEDHHASLNQSTLNDWQDVYRVRNKGTGASRQTNYTAGVTEDGRF